MFYIEKYFIEILIIIFLLIVSLFNLWNVFLIIIGPFFLASLLSGVAQGIYVFGVVALLIAIVLGVKNIRENVGKVTVLLSMVGWAVLILVGLYISSNYQ